MNRMNKILALLLLVQLALIAFVYRPNRTDTPPTIKFFESITTDQIVGLAITDNENTISMQKENGNWHLKTNPPYPADKKKIDALINKLANLTSSRLVSRTNSSHNRLQLTDNNFNHKLTLTLNDGSAKQLLLGSSPNYKTIHVRLPQDDNVYLVKGLADWEASTTTDDWWDNNYVDVDPGKLTKIILKNPSGQLELSRDEKNKWHSPQIPQDGELADEALHNFLNKACLIQLASYLDSNKNYSLKKPVVRLTLITADNNSTNLEIMVEDPQKDTYIAKTNHSQFYVSVHGYEIKALLDTNISTLLETEN